MHITNGNIINQNIPNSLTEKLNIKTKYSVIDRIKVKL